jgi:hypothetical protein
MTEERRLLSTRRRVPAASMEDYHVAWGVLATIARAAGVNAWRFRSATESDLFMEFLESRAADPRVAGEIDESLTSLERLQPGLTEEWIADY